MTVRSLRYRPGSVVVAATLSVVVAGLAVDIAVPKIRPVLLLLAALPPEKAVLYLLALAIALVVFAVEPFVGVLMLLAALPLEAQFPSLKLAGGLLFVVWFFRRLLRDESWKPLLSSPFFILTTVFIAFVLASSVWAVSAPDALTGVIQLFLLFAFSLLLIDLLRTWERAELMAKVLVFSGAVAAVLTLQQAFSGARRAGVLVTGQVNGTALMLLAIMPFAFYLMRGCERARWRALGLLYLPVAMAAIAFTYSRMGLILLPPVLLVLLWQTFRGGRGRALLMPLIALGVFGVVRFVPWDGIEDRLDTVPRYLESVLRPDNRALSVYSSRGYHLQIALEMGKDHPVIGAGYNSYGRLFKEQYQFVVRGAPSFWGTYRSPHSSWPGIFAELGAVGVLLWATLLATALGTLWKAWSSTRRRGNVRQHFFVQATIISLLLYVGPYSFYVPAEKEKMLWALLGLSIAIGRLVGELEAATVKVEPGRSLGE